MCERTLSPVGDSHWQENTKMFGLDKDNESGGYDREDGVLYDMSDDMQEGEFDSEVEP